MKQMLNFISQVHGQLNKTMDTQKKARELGEQAEELCNPMGD